jgi:hypothetical protein
MQMQAAAGALGKRFGHEGRLETGLGGDALGDALVHHRLVGGAQGVGPVPQGDLELARRILRDRPFQRHALDVGGGPELAQEAAEVLEFPKAVDPVLARPLAGSRRRRELGGAIGVSVLVDQIVFELAGDDGRQSIVGESGQHPAEHMAGIQVIGRSVELVDRGDDLGDILAEPRRQRQGSRRRPSQPIGVAVPPDEPRFLAVPSRDVTHQHRSWQETPLIEHRHHLVAAQAFAPGHT